MSYIRAEDVLPQNVLALVQMYIDGAMLYVPKRSEKRSDWGALSGTKAYYAGRNEVISEEYRKGADIRELANRYFLSEKSIQRIVSAARKSGSENHEPRE